MLKELAEAKGDSGLQQLRIAALEKSLAKLTKEIFGPSTEQRPASATADSNDEDDKSKDEKTRRERARCAWIPRADFFGEMRERKCASVRFFREGIR